MTQRAIVIRAEDNVATALADLEPGVIVEVRRGDQALQVELRAAVRFGHKFAILPIAAGSPVLKYGETIGRSTRPIGPGEHVHVHNLESLRGRGDVS